MWSDWFPDAPAWLPWSAVIMWVVLATFILSALFPSPVEAWHRRRDRVEADRQFLDLKRYQRIQADLSTPPAKKGVTAELARIGKDG